MQKRRNYVSAPVVIDNVRRTSDGSFQIIFRRPPIVILGDLAKGARNALNASKEARLQKSHPPQP